MTNPDQSATGTSHVGPVIFADETARGQLVEEGVVVSFRTADRTTGDTWWRESRTGPKRGDCHIESLGSVSAQSLGKALQTYADRSGFGDARAWLDAIEDLHGGVPEGGWLYRVVEGHRG